MMCALVPRQPSLVGDPEHKAAPSQITPKQEHLAGRHDFVFRRAEVKKDRLTRLRKVRLTGVTTQDTSFAAMGEVCRDCTHIALWHSSIIGTRGIGARLAPILGFGIDQSSSKCEVTILFRTVRSFSKANPRFDF